MLGNVYLDAPKGLVLTADRALSLVRDKVERGRAAALFKEIQSNRKASEAAKRQKRHAVQVARMRALEMSRRASLSGMRVDVFETQYRSLKERRALARRIVPM